MKKIIIFAFIMGIFTVLIPIPAFADEIEIEEISYSDIVFEYEVEFDDEAVKDYSYDVWFVTEVGVEAFLFMESPKIKLLSDESLQGSMYNVREYGSYMEGVTGIEVSSIRLRIFRYDGAVKIEEASISFCVCTGYVTPVPYIEVEITDDGEGCEHADIEFRTDETAEGQSINGYAFVKKNGEIVETKTDVDQNEFFTSIDVDGEGNYVAKFGVYAQYYNITTSLAFELDCDGDAMRLSSSSGIAELSFHDLQVKSSKLYSLSGQLVEEVSGTEEGKFHFSQPSGVYIIEKMYDTGFRTIEKIYLGQK